MSEDLHENDRGDGGSEPSPRRIPAPAGRPSAARAARPSSERECTSYG